MKNLNYYLALAEKGNADAAFEAAKIMHDEKSHDFIVQRMLKKAAKLGNPKAKRWLAFLCLNDTLIDDSASSFPNIIYVKDYSVAYELFKQAACADDTLSLLAVYKCLQYGIGVESSPEKAEKLLSVISEVASYDMLPIMAFFDAYSKPQQHTHKHEYKTVIGKLLAG